MDDKKNETKKDVFKFSTTKLIVVIVFAVLFLSAGTYAYWLWTSNVNKNVVFNTISGLEDYIVYNEGDSYFIGDFKPFNTFCESVNTSVSFYKTDEVANRKITAAINMDINSIGENITWSNSVYWVVTEGDNTIDCHDNGLETPGVLAYGTFRGVVEDDSLELLWDIDVTLEEKEYTVWIWIDSIGDELTDLSGNTLDTNIWTEFTLYDSSYSGDTITSYQCNNKTEGSAPYTFTYSGNCEVLEDVDNGYRVKFLTSGELNLSQSLNVDVFLVGGGGGGACNPGAYGGGGGGSGYITNVKNINLDSAKYDIIIGDGGVSATAGGMTSAFTYTALGGNPGNGKLGGDGGSGGGAGGYDEKYYPGRGGEYGSNGFNHTYWSYPNVLGMGSGQVSCEFGEGVCDSGRLYASGGSGGSGLNDWGYTVVPFDGISAGAGGGGSAGASNGNGGIGKDAVPNTGSGGGGGGGSGQGNPSCYAGGTGGSGIVVIRNARDQDAIETKFGAYLVQNRENIANLNNNVEAKLYRYQGNVTDVNNNYVCFGTSDKNTCLSDTDKYMYRIIGIRADGLVKLMKKESLNDGMKWSTCNTTYCGEDSWITSEAYGLLNGSAFLENTTYVPTSWKNKIASVDWKYGKTTEDYVVWWLYTIEDTFTTSVNAKISLMYMHDFAYSAQSGGGLHYCSQSQCVNSWMLLKDASNDSSAPTNYEWLMTYYGFQGDWYRARIVTNTGYFGNTGAESVLSVRPVFYLDKNVEYVSGTGLMTDPYIIN